MDSKSATKSRIPTAIHKKEQLSDATTPKLHTKEAFKRETKITTLKPKTSCEMNVKTKTSSEIQIAKRNVDKKTTSEKSAGTLKNLKPKTQNKNILPKGIESLSREMVNLMKTPKIQELKTSSKLGGVGKSRVSKLADEASSSQTKKNREDAPSRMTAPKIPTVNPLWRERKLRRRSRTEHEINLGNVVSSSIRPLLKSVLVKETQNANYEKDAVKYSVLQECSTGKETCATLENNLLPKETSTPIKPIVRSGCTRVGRMLPLERKETKPINSGLKPLKRSNTIHVFDSVPVRKSATTLGKVKDTLGLEAGKASNESENQLPSQVDGKDLLEAQVNSLVTPKKQLPHGGIPFKVCRMKPMKEIFNTESKT